ncbi:uncharacterized protein ARMOST_21976 [Armillaria ostoyae]|uniref:Uncharacterized protein n=1 Tax=Armillaria ostoyae TaxID=47428 RepID=A0A284SBK6_ARMOS|nr:uncharacterized protein ARMOST_21976 [Armillaria ostoyae]
MSGRGNCHVILILLLTNFGTPALLPFQNIWLDASVARVRLRRLSAYIGSVTASPASMPLTRSGSPFPGRTGRHPNLLRTVLALHRDFESAFQTLLSANDRLRADLASAQMEVERLERELEKSLADRNEQEEAMLRLIEGSPDQSDDEALLARRLVGAKDTIRLLEEEVDRLGLMVSPDLGALTAQLTCPQCLGTMRSVMRYVTTFVEPRHLISSLQSGMWARLLLPMPIRLSPTRSTIWRSNSTALHHMHETNRSSTSDRADRRIVGPYPYQPGPAERQHWWTGSRVWLRKSGFLVATISVVLAWPSI